MKITNIYKVSLLNKKDITVVGHNINDVIYTITAKKYNEETSEYEESEYKEEDITSISLKESDVICPNYL